LDSLINVIRMGDFMNRTKTKTKKKGPPRSIEDEEYYDLRFILHQARQNNDVITWRKVLEKSDEFFSRNPEYKYGCWGAHFYTL
jgi:hypothetical protein